MTQRDGWTFEYGIEEVKDAAERRVEFHSKRIEFWTKEKESVLQAIRDSGLDIREHEITGGKRAEVVIDPTHQNRLNECQAGIAKHQGLVEQYEGWAQVLHSRVIQDDRRTLHLDHQDILYFGLQEISG